MAWNWKLYQEIDGSIPKDLLSFFVRMLPHPKQFDNLPAPVLTLSETKRLQINLKRLCQKGLASLTSDNFDKLDNNLYEFKLTKSQHNPRFIITTATPQQFIILHAFKKKYNGAIKNHHKRPAQERLKRLQERENQ